MYSFRGSEIVKIKTKVDEFYIQGRKVLGMNLPETQSEQPELIGLCKSSGIDL